MYKAFIIMKLCYRNNFPKQSTTLSAAHPAFTSIGQNGLIIQSSPPVPSVRASALVGVVVVLAAVGGGGGGGRCRCAAVLL